MTDDVVDYLAGRQKQVRDRFEQLLRIASVSTDPRYAPEMAKARDFLLARFREIGLDDVQLLDGGKGEPAVYGAWLGAAGAPTVLIYGHYDVQPAGPLEAWNSPPFEPTERNGRIYARGASDVKGSTTIAIETVAGFLAVEGRCPVNVKFFLEGEEETGSPGLPGIVDRYRDLLAADAMISADGGRGSLDVPTINIGIRGLAKLNLSLSTARKDVHSGKYGGAIRNALHEMAALLASLHDENGEVVVKGFDDGGRQLTPEEKTRAAALPFDEDAFYAEVGALPAGDPGLTVRERLTLRPALDINGMWGGYTGSGTMTVIPHEAFAKLTMRIAPGQDAEKLRAAVAAHLQAHVRPGVGLTVDSVGAVTSAYSLDETHPLVKSAQAVLARTTGRAPVLMRHAATVPIITLFKEVLGIDTLMFGSHLPDEDVHAPNEFFRLTSFAEGLEAWVLFLRKLAEFEPREFRPVTRHGS